MAKNLVIVESPTKVKTIKKFLGKNYEVMASQGHVRDLPKSRIGVDIEHDFEPAYITIRGKGDLLKELRREAKKADTVYLATDPDREGEAISWHLIAALDLDRKKYKRITFNEITKNAVKNSFSSSRDIDSDLVDAQQARRVLDRIVGYQISPLLWAKVKRGLSAGRVQSSALRMIADRENEINDFIPKEYYSLSALFSVKGKKEGFLASYAGKGKAADGLLSREEAEEIMNEAGRGTFRIDSVKTGKRSRKAPAPFTTSTLQQSASSALNFAVSKTMLIAQQLYEGVDLKGFGTVGLITYLRTDSVRVSDEARKSAHEFITKAYGKEYAAPESFEAEGRGGTKKIQDAHEAIRPADLTILPSEIKDELSRDQYRLYKLIFDRFIASRMEPSVYATVSARLSSNKMEFLASGSRKEFAGWEVLYNPDDEEKGAEEGQNSNAVLFSIDENSIVTFSKFEKKQHFTEAPPHFTEASLVKAMEELGIGRPSTYSPTITTLLKRHYISKEKRALFITELGEVVNSLMKDSFPEIVDTGFTANLESLLDGVEEGKVEWKSIIRNFYPDFEKEVKKADEEISKVKIEDEVTDIICDKCGRNMVIKFGPHGKFLACPGFPECRNTKPLLQKIGVSCPKCGKELVERKTKKGRRFYGCEDYPECDFVSWSRPIKKKCPRCGGLMTLKGKKALCADQSCGYSEAYEGD